MRTVLAIVLMLAAALPAAAQDAQAPATTSAPVPTAAPAAPATTPSPAAVTDTTSVQNAAPSAEPTDAERAQAAAQFYNSLTRQTGVITIADNKVTLTVPATHYFVGPEDARRIIVDLWGNPPTSAEGVNGMIFPEGANPAAGAWGAVVQYVGEGYVPDDEARTTNYTDLLHQMQESGTEENNWRREHNYPTIQLLGWAEPPHYDAQEHKLYWAKELIFQGAEGAHTLNYDIRVLGREGHLVVSFVAGMEELPVIRQNAPAIMAMPRFTSGHSYADYRQGDHRAEYGIAGLIAGGTLVAVAQKTGLLAIILAFGKKFIVLILAGLAGLGGVIKRMFGGGKSEG